MRSDRVGAEQGPALADALMAYMHPQLDLYGIDAMNEAEDQVADLVLIATRYLAPDALPDVDHDEVLPILQECWHCYIAHGDELSCNDVGCTHDCLSWITRARELPSLRPLVNEDGSTRVRPYRPGTCACPPCPGRGNDGHGMTHCAECCFGSGVEADEDCPDHGRDAVLRPGTPDGA